MSGYPNSSRWSLFRNSTWDKPAPEAAEGVRAGVWEVPDDAEPQAKHGGFSLGFRTVMRWFGSEKARLKGRDLIRSYAAGGEIPAGADAGAAGASFAQPQALDRVHSGGLVDVGDAKVGLVRPPRQRSSSPGHHARKPGLRAGHLNVPVEHHAHEERSSSVPPQPKSWAQMAAAADTQPPAAAKPCEQPPLLARAISREVSKEVQGTLTAPHHGRKLKCDVRRQLRLVVAGLMGSGKSTVCRMLSDLLEGQWVNQDEFSHLKKGAKRAFLEEIKRVSGNSRVPVLIVDKINTMVQHRAEILDAMSGGVPGDVVFVQIAHPDDSPGSLRHQLELCLARIRSRGEGHRTLMGTDPKLESILKMAAGGAQKMDAAELSRFTAHFNLNMTVPPTQSIMQLLADLDNHSLLGRFHVDELVTQERLEKALQVTMQVEKSLAKPHPSSGGVDNKQDRRAKAPIWIYQAEVDEAGTERILELWNEHVGETSGHLTPQKAFHCTLLYVGGGSDSELLLRHPHMANQNALHALREKLQGATGQEIDLGIRALVWDDHIACLEVGNMRDWSANLQAHITLALKRGIAPVVSNELLCRRAANADLQANLAPWLKAIGLEYLADGAKEYCRNNGITSADGFCEQAADASLVLEKDEDQQHRIKQVLSRSAPGPVREVVVSQTTLHARVNGRRRGE